MLLTLTLPHRLLNLSSSSSSSPRLALLLLLFFFFPHSWGGRTGLFSQSWLLFWGKCMHVTRSSHLEKHDWLETCHMETDAFRVHKKLRRMVATGWLQPITTTHSRNDQIIVYLAFLGIVDRTSYRGQNYSTNMIIIVHLATLPSGSLQGKKIKPTWN